MQLPKPKALRPHITRNSEGVPCKAMPVWRPHPVSPYSSCTTTCRSSLLHKYCSQHQEQGETFWNWKGREVWNEERYCESVEKRETERNEGRRRGSLKQRGRVQTHQRWRIVIFQLTIFFPRCSTIEEKAATGLRLCTGKKKKKTAAVIGLPSHYHLPNHREESSASSPPPPASSPAATALPVDNNTVRSRRRKQNKGEQGWRKKTQRRERRKAPTIVQATPQAATTSTSTKPLQRGKNIVDRGEETKRKVTEKRGTKWREEGKIKWKF